MVKSKGIPPKSHSGLEMMVICPNSFFLNHLPLEAFFTYPTFGKGTSSTQKWREKWEKDVLVTSTRVMNLQICWIIYFKGQGRYVYPVHVRVLPWYFLCSTLGFLGINTTLFWAYIGISHRGRLGPRYIQLSLDF